MIMEFVSGGELFDYIVKHGKVCTIRIQIDLGLISFSFYFSAQGI